ncbi:FadR/GntR family transcriptional regulator [Rhodobium gokarnense]|uniref:DNA-binding FadR family transcriptional regulator n=1 Tax=Rhodobium gokarnense TaxID=364296 RepID=A0ABT3HF38_9HYPH|nr:FCD domain-containing protein [Rhodobium gokarnense]MCW2309015.1 DNA-binding FadR family transcriptional regulator [Rhodobium gokarnense]
MSDTTDSPAPVVPPQGARRRKRPDIVAEAIRDRIMQSGLVPGDRIPADWLDTEALKVSRGTLREALKVLEFEGLIATKTGPGGGAFVAAIVPENALRMLDNLFLFSPPSIADIYAIRKLLEPELAASAADGSLSPEAFAALEATIRLYEAEPSSGEEEYRQRMAELDFHAELARSSPNRLLGFIAVFLLSLLRDMTVCREIYREPHPELRETGLSYQVLLMRAIRARDAERARTIMREHMIEAEKYMLERAVMRERPASKS